MTVSLSDGRIFIHAQPFGLLALRAKLAGRISSDGIKWENKKTALSIPVTAVNQVSDILPTEGMDAGVADLINLSLSHCNARIRFNEIVRTSESRALPGGWNEKLEQLQAVAVNALCVSGIFGACLFDEQGSGKTVMTIAAFDVLREEGRVQTLLVVCPKNMMATWASDFEKMLPGKYLISVAAGKREERRKTHLSNYDVLVVSYDNLDDDITSLVSIAGATQTVITFDESFYAKNPQAKRTDAALKLRDACVLGYVLCGTPAPNAAQDIVTQFNLADGGFAFGGFAPSDDCVDNASKIEALIETRGTMIRRLKTDILPNLPPKNFHVVSLPMSGRQAMLYERSKEQLEIYLRTLDNRLFRKSLATYFQKRAALLQICACPKSIDPNCREDSTKILKLDRMLQRLIVDEKKKVVVWSYYTASINEIVQRYRSYNPVRIDGTQSSQGSEAIRLFQTDPNTWLFVGNPAAAGAGITLHAASEAIYVSYPNQAAQYLQSIDRIHRRGQSAPETNYWLLVCSNSIEEGEVMRLRRKEILQNNLLGDPVSWPNSLDDALAELNCQQ